MTTLPLLQRARICCSKARLGLSRSEFSLRSLSTDRQKEYETFFEQHLSYPFLQYRQPLNVARAEKQFIYETNGRRYLDFISGISTVGIGHCHPRIVDAAYQQMKNYGHLSSFYMNNAVKSYAEELLKHFNGDLEVCLFVNSGSEAIDLAIRMAREYTKKFEVISLRSSYHGLSQSVLPFTNIAAYKRPYVVGSHVASNADPYRGPWGGKSCRDSIIQTTRTCECAVDRCSAADHYLKDFEDILQYELPKQNLAAYLAEPIQGYGGIIQFCGNFLQRSAELVQKNGGLFIADEVQTGFGRTGSHFWGFEAHNIKPDIVVMAKTIANGTVPFAAVVTRKDIAREARFYFNTFGGNTVGCASAKAVLEVIDDEKLQDNCKRVGLYLLTKLGELRTRSKIVGDVRGKGLMIGIELVADKFTKEPLPVERVNSILNACKENGLLIGKCGNFKNIIRLLPPMCVTIEDATVASIILNDVIHADECRSMSV